MVGDEAVEPLADAGRRLFGVDRLRCDQEVEGVVSLVGDVQCGLLGVAEAVWQVRDEPVDGRSDDGAQRKRRIIHHERSLSGPPDLVEDAA
ncbi:MAG: hypothetical protein EA423_11015 [Phycisphaerales bacterium]|nr:MAG: hypothetical protein EA423_11015 [Phycisphaerales bacterium]